MLSRTQNRKLSDPGLAPSDRVSAQHSDTPLTSEVGIGKLEDDMNLKQQIDDLCATIEAKKAASLKCHICGEPPCHGSLEGQVCRVHCELCQPAPRVQREIPAVCLDGQAHDWSPWTNPRNWNCYTQRTCKKCDLTESVDSSD